MEERKRNTQMAHSEHPDHLHQSTRVEYAFPEDASKSSISKQQGVDQIQVEKTLRSCPPESEIKSLTEFDALFIGGLRPRQRQWFIDQTASNGDSGNQKKNEKEKKQKKQNQGNRWHLDQLEEMGLKSRTVTSQLPPGVSYEWNPSPGLCDPSKGQKGGNFLFVWLGALSPQVTDFLATFDADPQSPTYGQPVATVSTPALQSMPHHGAYWLAPNNYAPFNSFGANRSWMFDLNQPCRPKLVREMINPTSNDGVVRLWSPHSFYPLGNGNYLGSFQEGREGPHGAGGLAQYTPDGVLVRWSSAFDPKFPDATFRPYGIAVLEHLNRIVTTNFAMNPPPASDLIQVWQLSGLRLLSTIQIPATRPPGGNSMPFELCPLPDRRSVAVFSGPSGCIWRVSQLDQTCPRIALVGKIATRGGVSVPICLGPFILVAIEGDGAVVVLDASQPAHIVEHSRLKLPAGYQPHMLSYDAFHSRVAILDFDPMDTNKITGIIFMAQFDQRDGSLTLDPNWQVDTRQIALWPQGQIGGALGHAAVFSNPPQRI